MRLLTGAHGIEDEDDDEDDWELGNWGGEMVEWFRVGNFECPTAMVDHSRAGIRREHGRLSSSRLKMIFIGI